jgi:hypothetical protein
VPLTPILRVKFKLLSASPLSACLLPRQAHHALPSTMPQHKSHELLAPQCYLSSTGMYLMFLSFFVLCLPTLFLASTSSVSRYRAYDTPHPTPLVSRQLMQYVCLPLPTSNSRTLVKPAHNFTYIPSAHLVGAEGDLPPSPMTRPPLSRRHRGAMAAKIGAIMKPSGQGPQSESRWRDIA